MPKELVFNIWLISDNFSTELGEKCENNAWKHNLDRQWQRQRERAGSSGVQKKKKNGSRTAK